MKKAELTRKQLDDVCINDIYKYYDNECIIIYDHELFEKMIFEVDICIESYKAGLFFGTVYIDNIRYEEKRSYDGSEFETKYGFSFYHIID